MKPFPFRSDVLATRAVRILWLCYFITLTWLLVNRSPIELVRSQETFFAAAELAMPWSHLAGFGVLAVLTFVARWPISRWLTVLLLVLYSLATEYGQTFIPTRHPQLIDLAQNFAGIALGCGLAWAAGLAVSRWWPAPDGQPDLV
ncbi:MAG: VanZ family protein [Pirellulales bacterium]|nr:VanZ family protein [Pirellulales bacterium]